MPQSTPHTSPDSALDPKRPSQVVLVLFLVGFCSRGYRIWDQVLRLDMAYWVTLAKGLGGFGTAPAQYRIGALAVAYWISQHSPLRLSRAFSLLELGGSITAALVLYGVLRSSTAYRGATLAMRWFASASFVALFLYYVDWAYWYEKLETLPTAGIMALLLLLWTRRDSDSMDLVPQSLRALGIVAVCAAQAFVRADIAISVCAGIFLAALSPLGNGLSLPRKAALATATLAGILVAAIQVYLIKVRFPAATYGVVPVFMLRYDYNHFDLWLTCLIFMAPFLWTAYQISRYRFDAGAAGLGYLIAGVIYFALWVAVGRLDEVRIFLPMALCSVPSTVVACLGLLNRQARTVAP